jgi:hypothetical protein
MSAHPKSEIANFKSQIPSPPSPKSEIFWDNVGATRSFNLSELQLLAIDHTLRGTRDSRIAEILDISRRTLWSWKTFNEDYRRALAEGRAAIHDALVDQLQAASAKASATLDDLLDDSDPQTRLRAAQITLRAVVDLRPKLPKHQYHTPQSLHIGITAPNPPQPQVQSTNQNPAPREIESFEQLPRQLPPPKP